MGRKIYDFGRLHQEIRIKTLNDRWKSDTELRAEAAEKEVREILAALKRHCEDDFVIISDGAIDWSHTIAEFVSFVRLDAIGK